MSQIAKAASVLLARGSGPAELFVVRRNPELRFMGGFMAFPGGKVSPSDREVPIEMDGAANAADIAPERYVSAARELFEEAGVLIARRADGSFPPGGSLLEYLRRKLMADEMGFAQVLSHLEARLHAADFVSVGAVTTPAFVATRFNTIFFLVRMPENQQAEVWPGELDLGQWQTPEAVLASWRRGDCLVSPPSVLILQAVQGLSVNDIPNRLTEMIRTQTDDGIHSIYFTPDVLMIPLHTQALPPSTHTNAYLVGRNPSYLLDPGPNSPEEQARLFEIVDRHLAAGNQLAAVVLTHEHPDHVGAAKACAERYHVPIYAHAITAQKLKAKLQVDRLLDEGDQLDLGTAPDGNGSWRLEAIYTPGHSLGHLAFYEPRYRLLFAGDMVSTLSSVVIALPDGDLAVYLEALKRLQALDTRLLLPGHGSPSAKPAQTLQDCLDHRAMREEQLLAALAGAPRSVPDLARELYKGLLPIMMRFAEMQVLAGLKKLQREGRVQASSTDQTELWSVRKTPS